MVIAVLLLLAAAMPAQAQAHPTSVNVGVIGGPVSVNGGGLPTTGNPAFSAFTFTTITVSPLGSIAGYDTLVLNVGSPAMACTTATLSAAEKASLVTFVQNGGKLIIYESECPTNDYTWLPVPLQFTTYNPGAHGDVCPAGSGCGATIVVNTNLGTRMDSGVSPLNIDLGNSGVPPPPDVGATASGLGPTTDAVGDANVMVARGSDLCRHIDAVTGPHSGFVLGPTHVFSRDGGAAGSGELIYNGFDTDTMGAATVPATSGFVNDARPLAKIFLLELSEPWQPHNKPCTPIVPAKPAVGGQILPANTMMLMAPWVALAAFVSVGVAVVLRRRFTPIVYFQ
jgi:hypothetical protein